MKALFSGCIGRYLSRAMFGKLANIFRSKERLVMHEPMIFASDLKVDVHSHFIPGIDDGADTIEDKCRTGHDMPG